MMIWCVPFLSKSQSTYLEVQDTRSQPTLPGDYNRAARFAFKDGVAIGIQDSRFCSLLGVRGWWNDDTGGPAHEIAFTSQNGMYYRAGTQAAGWYNWCKIISENVDGNVGIGTNIPAAKLTVNGNILAKEIKIKTDITVPDYVFHPSYQLPTLSSIEEYVRTYRHLPEIPSAAEIQKTGIDLTEMNLALLKKVEELTLHLISKEKEIEALKVNQAISSKEFSERLSKLENAKVDK